MDSHLLEDKALCLEKGKDYFCIPNRGQITVQVQLPDPWLAGSPICLLPREPGAHSSSAVVPSTPAGSC